jgi:hypothetical protein
MDDTQRLNSTSPRASAELEPARIPQDILAGLAVVGLVAASFRQSLASWAENVARLAERRHHRAQLLAAYRRRRAWKKSDVPHLKSLGVNNAALSRIERLAGRGRPVVKPYQPLDVAIKTKLSAFQSFVDPNASPDKRKQGFKTRPWWQHYVEALYRGEHALAKDRGAKPNRRINRSGRIGRQDLGNFCGDSS